MTTATKTQAVPKFSDRVRFNWGYHDAASDAGRGQARETAMGGPQNPRRVSREYDAAYYDGYVCGISDTANGIDTASSTSAWLRSGNDPAEA